MGSTLFLDKTRDSVPKVYLEVLGDLDSVINYAWGAAALAYLYHYLRAASRRETTQISGCLTLLECWIYEYFTELRTRSQAAYYDRRTPRALRCNNSQTFTSSTRDLVHYRKLLDNYPSSHVNWTPFGRPSLIPPASLFHGCLTFMDYAEGYMPKRVARQFGRVQRVPPTPIDFDHHRSNLGAKARGYKKVYGSAVAYWNEMQNHNYPLHHLGLEAVVPDSTTPDYPA